MSKVLFWVVIFNTPFALFSQESIALKMNDNQILRLLNICLSKTLEIKYNCVPDTYKSKPDKFVVRIKLDDMHSDSIKIIIGEPWSKFDLKQDSTLYGYLKINKHPVFLLIENVVYQDKKLFVKDKDKLMSIVEEQLTFPFNSGHFSPVIYLFKINKEELNRMKGNMKYEVIYPIGNIECNDWPVRYSPLLPNYTVDYEGEYENAPWSYCNNNRFAHEKKIIVSHEELLKMKSGFLYFNLKKTQSSNTRIF